MLARRGTKRRFSRSYAPELFRLFQPASFHFSVPTRAEKYGKIRTVYSLQSIAVEALRLREKKNHLLFLLSCIEIVHARN